MTRAELVQRVVDKLIADRTDPGLAAMVGRVGFFTNGDAGLVEFARKLGVITVDETLE